MNLDPGAITLVQTTIIQHLSDALPLIARYALNLLYIFTAFELATFGLMAALRPNVTWTDLIFKIIKIGIIFFLIQNYGYLISIVISSFAKIAGVIVNVKGLEHFIFNPAKIWQFGYNNALSILQAATASNSMSLAMVQTVIGLGILLTFGLIGINIVINIVAFYFTSLIGLIFLPFGAFNLFGGIFNNAVSAILKSGIRLMVLILVIGFATITWSSFNLAITNPDLATNLNQSLGLFFISLLFLCCSYYLPKLASEIIGQIDLRWQKNASSIVVPTNQPTTQLAPAQNLNQIQAAAQINPSLSTQPGFANSGSSIVSGTSLATDRHFSSPAKNNNKANSVAEGSAINKSISDRTLRQIKKTITNLLNDQKRSTK